VPERFDQSRVHQDSRAVNSVFLTDTSKAASEVMLASFDMLPLFAQAFGWQSLRNVAPLNNQNCLNIKCPCIHALD
jgi:hypothetical protein